MGRTCFCLVFFLKLFSCFIIYANYGFFRKITCKYPDEIKQRYFISIIFKTLIIIHVVLKVKKHLREKKKLKIISHGFFQSSCLHRVQWIQIIYPTTTQKNSEIPKFKMDLFHYIGKTFILTSYNQHYITNNNAKYNDRVPGNTKEYLYIHII